MSKYIFDALRNQEQLKEPILEYSLELTEKSYKDCSWCNRRSLMTKYIQVRGPLSKVEQLQFRLMDTEVEGVRKLFTYLECKYCKRHFIQEWLDN